MDKSNTRQRLALLVRGEPVFLFVFSWQKEVWYILVCDIEEALKCQMSAHRKSRAMQTHYNLLANNSPLGKIQLFDGKFCGLGNILWHTFNRNLFYTRVELRASCVCVLQGHNFPSSLSAAYTIVVVVVVRSILILHTGIFVDFLT